jgi:pSer/pThr/pTyr-binding forkhead associated (FHA) protein
MMSIGRSSASDIVLKSDDYVSGQHARLTRHGGVLYVEDIGSTNGTYVNDNRAVGATLLKSGDKVRVGSTTFRYAE